MYKTIKIVKINDRLLAMKSLLSTNENGIKILDTESNIYQTVKKIIDMVENGIPYSVCSKYEEPEFYGSSDYFSRIFDRILDKLLGMQIEIITHKEKHDIEAENKEREFQETETWFNSLDKDTQEMVTRYHNIRIPGPAIG